EQDVGRVGSQRTSRVDQVVRSWGRVAPLTSDVEPGGYTLQSRVLVEEVRKPTGLIGGQGVHRVEQNRLDPSPPRRMFSDTMVQGGVEEAFGLAGARAGGHDRWLRRTPSR